MGPGGSPSALNKNNPSKEERIHDAQVNLALVDICIAAVRLAHSSRHELYREMG